MSATEGQPTPFRLEHDPWGRLVLVRPDGSRHVGVDPVRAFPVGDPAGPVALVDGDGRELAWVPRLADLPDALRRTVEDELAQRHFLPVIRRVLAVRGQVEPVECEADTDRGPVRFHIAAEEDVRRMGGGRVVIRGADGVRYLIPDLDALDRASRRLLDRYV